MFLLLTVVLVLFFEVTVVYDLVPFGRLRFATTASSNCISEKWGLLSDSIRDRVFADNYRYHVDATDRETLSAYVQ